jgi:AmmeMemoRadiSam system protein B
MAVRAPAVAGMFYPDHPANLRRDLEQMLGEEPALSEAAAPKAIIVPHAGYAYSGPVAASVYRRLVNARSSIIRVVLLGPAHRVYVKGMALPDVTGFATPLGKIPLDREAMETISSLPGVTWSNAAHAYEHSLEVQLPFLQMVLDDFRLVPVVVGYCDADLVAGVIDTLWGGPETLVVISSDLSHFLPYNRAREVDGNTCRRILDKASSLSGDEACGAYVINGLMRSQHCQDLVVEAVDLRNSGDTAGDKRRVVGYGAFILH